MHTNKSETTSAAGSNKKRSKAAKSAPKNARGSPKTIDERAADAELEAGLVVGVGSSAGGLTALKELVGALTEPFPACIVVAQHLSPSHSSQLTELLTTRTRWDVRILEEETKPSAGTILVVPPNRDAIARNGNIVPVALEAEGVGPRPNVDRLLQSVAVEFGDHSVAVILSGTGSDGSEGVVAVKRVGGLVLAQDPLTAQFDGMPKAAIATGSVDSVLPPEEMAAAISRLANSGAAGSKSPEESDASELARHVQDIHTIVRRATGLNLAHYKESTVLRRIRRRALLAGIDELADYVVHLSGHKDEAGKLAADLSVRVTSFFRDPENFEILNQQIRALCRSPRDGEMIRIWVPGCASGEEAYSIAIMFQEAIRELNSNVTLLMFVSDIDPKSVAMARLGSFPEAAIGSLPTQYLERYFERVEDRYLARNILKQNMIFATQNVVEDPPFSKLDLISCRNLMIYLASQTQRQVLSAFHYSLRPAGLLFLGASDSVEPQRDLFDELDRKRRLYRRSDHPVVYQHLGGGRGGSVGSSSEGKHKKTAAERPTRKPASERGREIVAAHYSPPAIVIDENDRILHFVGDLSPYVSLPRGPADWTVHQLLLAPLNAESRALIRRCRREQTSVRGGTYTLDSGGKIQRVTLVVHPDLDPASTVVMLAFEVRTPSSQESQSDAGVSLIRELELELTTTREHLQTVVEEVETSNEELQTVNEELQSSNEELQSTNEELQTSNEELTSINEELLTVNEELSAKTSELEDSRRDLLNVKESLPVGLISVDAQFKLRECNQRAVELALSETPADRSFLKLLPWKIPADRIIEDAAAVLLQSEKTERLINCPDGRFLRLEMVPEVLQSGTDSGGVILLIDDVTEEENARSAIEYREALLQTIIASSPVGTVLVNAKGQIEVCNPAISALCGRQESDLVGLELEQLIHADDRAQLRLRMESLKAVGAAAEQIDCRINSGSDAGIWVNVAMRSTAPVSNEATRWVVQIQDINARKQSQQKMALEHLQMSVLTGITRRFLDVRSFSALQGEAVSQLSQVYDDLAIIYLHWRTDVGLVVVNHTLPGGESGDIGAAYEQQGSSFHLRRLLAHEPSEFHRSEKKSKAASEAYWFHPDAESAIDAPIFRHGVLAGVIRLESPSQRIWSDFDSTMLMSIADLLSIAERDNEAVAERERVFRDMEAQRNRIEVTLSSIGDGVITTNTEGQIDFINPAAEEMLGADSAACVGKSLFNVYRVIRGETGERIPNVVERCLDRGAPVEDADLDLFLMGVGERRIAVNHSAAPIRNQEGQLVGAVVVFRDVSNTRVLARELSYRAAHDPLTGLPNRDEFERRGEEALRDSRRSGASHAVVFIDLDQFKIINDTAGHSAGDAMLRKVADAMGQKLRGSDLLARMGGDEFAILLPRCPAKKAEAIVGEIINEVSAIRLSWAGNEFPIGASAGVVIMGPEAESLGDTMDQADAACYEAKAAGRGRYVVSDHAAGQAKRIETSKVLGNLRTALKGNKFLVYAQQGSALGKKRGTAYVELLPRILGDGGKVESHERVQALSRRFTLEGKLDRSSIVSTCGHIRRTKADQKDAIFGINVSQESVESDDYVDFVEQQLNRHELDPAKLCLQLPEPVAAANLERSKVICQKLHALGCRIAIEDFGSQLGSFSLIRSLNPDYVRINLQPLEVKTDGRAAGSNRLVVEALVHVCAGINAATIAVGLELEAVRTELEQIGVDFLQLPVSDSGKLLEDWARR